MKYFAFINIYKFINFSKNLFSYIISRITKKSYIYGKPSFASFELSSKCNLRCPQCDVGNLLTNRKNNFLKYEEYKKIIKQIGTTLLDAIFYFQGEPFLNKNFSKYISYAKHYNIYTIISTNAQLIDKNLAIEIVKSKLDKIIISIDGTTQEVYEKYRHGGSLQKAIEAIKYINEAKIKLKSKTPYIEAQFIVFKFNEHQIEDFKYLAPTWGANKISIKSAQIHNPNENSDIITSIDKYSRYKKVNNNWQIKKDFNKACLRAWTGIVISADGNILPCCFDKQEKYIYENINNKSVVDIWRNNKSQLFRQNLLTNRASYDICRNCNE
jgi:radical SAM protein with 4Fe4S-binding SPASM domain